MRKYIIFKAQSMSAEGWENRMLAHTGATTNILFSASIMIPLTNPYLNQGIVPTSFTGLKSSTIRNFPTAILTTESEIGKL